MFNVGLRFESKGHFSLGGDKCLNVCLLRGKTQRGMIKVQRTCCSFGTTFSLCRLHSLKGGHHFWKSFLRGGFEFEFSQEVCHILLVICGEISLCSRRKCQLVWWADGPIVWLRHRVTAVEDRKSLHHPVGSLRGGRCTPQVDVSVLRFRAESLTPLWKVN